LTLLSNGAFEHKYRVFLLGTSADGKPGIFQRRTSHEWEEWAETKSWQHGQSLSGKEIIELQFVDNILENPRRQEIIKIQETGTLLKS